MISKISASRKLRSFFKKNRVARMDELFILLETISRMTVFRRLQELNYISSFTHTGRYYTLKPTVHFDADGLWFCDGIGFSKFGNLKETICHLVGHSMAGIKHCELEKQLQVRTHNPLLELVRLNKINRQAFDKTYLYLSHQQDKAERQLACRQQNRMGSLDDKLPEYMVIEVLSEIIRSGRPEIDYPNISSRLLKNGFIITPTQCEDLCRRLGLKKTLDS